MTLLTNEELLFSSEGSDIILTNQRLQFTESEWGYAHRTIVFLENISSVEVRFQSNVWLIAFSVILAFSGMFMHNSQDLTSESHNGWLILGFGSSIFTLVLWWFTRKRILTIYSFGGQAMSVEIQKFGDRVIEDFLQKLFQAKVNRSNSMGRLLGTG